MHLSKVVFNDINTMIVVLIDHIFCVMLGFNTKIGFRGLVATPQDSTLHQLLAHTHLDIDAKPPYVSHSCLIVLLIVIVVVVVVVVV
jgi:hypothetical protein